MKNVEKVRKMDLRLMREMDLIEKIKVLKVRKRQLLMSLRMRGVKKVYQEVWKAAQM